MSADDARRRFTDAARHLLAPLPHGVEVRACTADEWSKHADAWWNQLDRPALDLLRLHTDDERAAIKDLDDAFGPPMEHRVVFTHEGTPVGAYWGQQERQGRYYMVNTIFDPAWRGRGLYRAFLPRVEAAAKETGFREMYSRHRADNNAVIVPKLRAGWSIAAFEVAPKFGLLVHLRKYLHDGFARAFGYRVDGGHAQALRDLGLAIP
ncbi:MAG TPA: GNAT family N-acetyltransferase [Kofleriaceae bacterium]|nr:GNAT family N-acetyltransferase [Kofleriaceae bacterium]